MASYIERATLHPRGWNEQVILPYGLRGSEIKAAIDDIYDFVHNINRFLVERGWDRLEETLSAATFSGVMSELVVEGVSKRSATIIKNQYHNGRPDLIPRGMYPEERCHRGGDGIEVKASRWSNGWQGHDRIMCAVLTEDDWSFSGRGATSRRTPTASIKRAGVANLEANAIYLDPTYVARPTPRKKTQVVITETEPESPT